MSDRIETIREWCAAKREQNIADHQEIVDDMEYLLSVIDGTHQSRLLPELRVGDVVTQRVKDIGPQTDNGWYDGDLLSVQRDGEVVWP